MKNVWRSFFVFALICLNPAAEACATFRNLFGPQVAHNVDWYPQLDQIQGLIMLNPHGLRKTAELLGANGEPKVWTSTKRSATFTIAAGDFPVSGFNEDGLTMAILMLNEESAAFPPDTNPLPVVPVTQFVQYNLDTSSTVKDVIASTRLIRPASKLKMHYFACDENRDCVIIQYINGEVRVHETQDLPVLTNYLYPTNGDGRFNRLAELRAKMTEDQSFPLQAYSALNQVAQSADFATRFQLIYDAPQGRMYIRRHGQKDMAWVHVNFSNLKTSKDRRAILIDADVRGNLSRRWKPVTAEMQEKVARLSGQPPAAAKIVSEYIFKSVTCVEELSHNGNGI